MNVTLILFYRIMLQGSDFRRSGQNCLRFYYSMNGFHCGTLDVYTRTNNGPRVIKWKMLGDQGKGWDRAAVDLDMNSVNEVCMLQYLYVYILTLYRIDTDVDMNNICVFINAFYLLEKHCGLLNPEICSTVLKFVSWSPENCVLSLCLIY